MIERHGGSEERAHTFDRAWERLNASSAQQLTTRAGTPFVAGAAITTKGKRRGERVIRYFQDGQEYGRCYECCWEHYYNCNRTRIGMYSKAVDEWTGSTGGVRKLTRDELLALIQQNGGPSGLDLAGKDLGELDLEIHSLAEEMAKRGVAGTDSVPSWVYWDPVTRTLTGINLQGAILKGARLAYANLRGACLRGSDLEGANLYYSNLQGADLRHAKLRSARLEGADLQSAALMAAGLQDASLERADLRGVGLMVANLQGARLQQANLQEVDLLDAGNLKRLYLFRAKLERTRLTSDQLGDAIGEETSRRYREAKEAYLGLKNNFETIGRYKDATWAYVKERKMEKTMNHPLHAREYFGTEYALGADVNWRSRKWWQFYFRHAAKWASDWLVELTCGYGESIMRVLLTLAAVYALFTLGYGLTWSVMKVATATDSVTRAFTGNPVDWAMFSLGAMTTMDPVGLEPRNNLVQLAAGIEALLGIFLTGLLGFVAANRIRRS